MSRIMSYTEVESWVRSVLPEKRFKHSLGVASTAAMLASRFLIDNEAALISGIYHDAYRYIGYDEAMDEVRRYGISIYPEEEENANLLHAPIAAFHMRADIGLVPESWVRAVRFHTLGSKDMGALGAVIYIADYSEPGRKHIDDEERKRIFSLASLEAMVLHILDSQNRYFKEKGICNACVTDELYSFLRDGGRFES